MKEPRKKSTITNTLQSLLIISFHLLVSIHFISVVVASEAAATNESNEKEFSNPISIKIHTYIDPEHNLDNELLSLWKDAWKTVVKNCEIVMLRPNDAKRHSKYEYYQTLLNDSTKKVKSHLSYLRHIAMSTIENGGFFSEPYVFPLKQFPQLKLQLNDTVKSQFTSYDGVVGSFMSGSYQEWNRVTHLLLTKYLDKNIVYSFKQMKDQPGSETIVFEPDYHTVIPPAFYLTSWQFQHDFCLQSQDQRYQFIRFHSSDLRKHGVEKHEKNSIIQSWLNVYMAKCLQSQRPVIYTFFEPVDILEHERPLELLELWKSTWFEAGWEPIVLSLLDAKRHPKFLYYHEKLFQYDKFSNEKNRYNYFCFMRWVAVTASGGGWMSDYDTFPLIYTSQNMGLPNDGRLTGHSYLNPNFVSGSVSEWNRMTELLFASLSQFYTKQDMTITDFHTLKKIHLHNVKSFIFQQHNMKLHDFYQDNTINNAASVADPFDLRPKCFLPKDKLVVHFSHYSCSQLWFCSYGDKQHQVRVEVARDWLNSWKNQCILNEGI